MLGGRRQIQDDHVLVYLSQFKAEYEAKDQQRVEEIKRTMNKMIKLKSEVTNLEAYIDNMRKKNLN